MPNPPIKPPHKGPPRSGKPGKDAAPAKVEAPVRKERIAKRLARAGVASRREVERLIGLGRIAVNGRVLDTPAVLVGRDDVVTLDGRPVERPEATRVWRFHKPVGLMTTHRDPQGRPTVFEALPEGMPRVISVGRLDINSEGLLLLTNDGELSRALELPTTGWVRRYRARARGRVTQEQLDRLKDGMTIDGVRYGSIEATLDKAKEAAGGKAPANLWITVSLTEGKNREVRKVLEHLGVTENRLIRLSYGPFQLGTLAEGEVAEVGPRVIREQLSGLIHPESLPQGDEVEPLPTGVRKASPLADPKAKPSRIRAAQAKREALAAEAGERAAAREAREERFASGDRPRRDFRRRDGGPERPRGDRPRGPFKPREGGGEDRPRRPFKPREGGADDRPRSDRPRGPYKPREGAEGDRPKRPYKPRVGGGEDRPRSDRPRGPYKSREDGDGDRPRSGPRPGGKPGGRPGGPRPGGPRPGGPRPGGPRGPKTPR